MKNSVQIAHSPITETHRLPSDGKLYNGMDPNITLRCMTTFEEKMRLGGGSFCRTMINILNSCIIDPPEGFDAGTLTDFDLWFLIYKLRVITYGPQYMIEASCSKCGKRFTAVADLDSLKVTTLDDDYESKLSFTLPQSGDEIKIKFIQAKEVDEISEESARILSRSPEYYGDPEYLLLMEHQIDTVNGAKLTKMDLSKYVATMTGRDSAYFHRKVDQLGKYGIVESVSLSCEHCAGVDEYNLPFTGEFFRPSNLDE